MLADVLGYALAGVVIYALYKRSSDPDAPRADVPADGLDRTTRPQYSLTTRSKNIRAAGHPTDALGHSHPQLATDPHKVPRGYYYKPMDLGIDVPLQRTSVLRH